MNGVALQDDPSVGFGRAIKALQVLLNNEDNLLEVSIAAFFFFATFSTLIVVVLTCQVVGLLLRWQVITRLNYHDVWLIVMLTCRGVELLSWC